MTKNCCQICAGMDFFLANYDGSRIDMRKCWKEDCICHINPNNND